MGRLELSQLQTANPCMRIPTVQYAKRDTVVAHSQFSPDTGRRDERPAPPPKHERNLLHARRHIRALTLATECAELGARIRTIQLLTGLSANQLQHLFRHPLSGPRRGRHPDSTEWYHTANLLCRAEASILVVLFRRLAARGVDPPLALITAYRHYTRSCRASPRISFDRAFDLVAHASGRWFVTSRTFSVFACPACQSEYLTSVSLAPRSNHECPFCKLHQRYAKDPRIQAAYPSRAVPHDAPPSCNACWHERLVNPPTPKSA